jgi:hypothetical protein
MCAAILLEKLNYAEISLSCFFVVCIQMKFEQSLIAFVLPFALINIRNVRIYKKVPYQHSLIRPFHHCANTVMSNTRILHGHLDPTGQYRLE